MIICKNCMVVELTGRQTGFCSDKCRMQFKRKSNSKPEQTKVEQLTVTPELPPDDELFAGLPSPLRTYANGELGGDWYRRLIHKLKTTTLDELQTEGVQIPCWRYLMEQTGQKGFNE